MNSNEREEKLKQIRERQGSRQGFLYGQDIDFLLSLLDSQTTDGNLSHCALCEDTSFIYRDCVVAAATRMRDKCVRKVRELEAAWLGDSRTEANDDRSNAAYEKCCAARVIAKDLESLRSRNNE